MNPKKWIKANLPFMFFEKPREIFNYEKYLNDVYDFELLILWNNVMTRWELWQYVANFGVPTMAFPFQWPDGRKFVPGREGRDFIRNKIEKGKWHNMTKDQLHGQMRKAQAKEEDRRWRERKDMNDLEYENMKYDLNNPKMYVPKNYEVKNEV